MGVSTSVIKLLDLSTDFCTVRQNSQAATFASVSLNSGLSFRALFVQFHAPAVPIHKSSLPTKLPRTRIHPCFPNERGVGGVNIVGKMSWTLVLDSVLTTAAPSLIESVFCREVGWTRVLGRMLGQYMIWGQLAGTHWTRIRRQARRICGRMMWAINARFLGGMGFST
jgi:hypothetical protein